MRWSNVSSSNITLLTFIIIGKTGDPSFRSSLEMYPLKVVT